MGRPSLAVERRHEILDAFEACIAKTGVRGTSMADLAAAAGVQRQLVQHYFGRREDLVVAVVERVAERTSEEIERLLTSVAGADRLEAGLEYLFDFDPAYRSEAENLAWHHLRAEASSTPAVREIFRRTHSHLQQRIGEELGRARPDLSKERCEQCALAATALYLGLEQADFLGLPGVSPQSCTELARRLLRSYLEEE